MDPHNPLLSYMIQQSVYKPVLLFLCYMYIHTQAQLPGGCQAPSPQYFVETTGLIRSHCYPVAWLVGGGCFFEFWLVHTLKHAFGSPVSGLVVCHVPFSAQVHCIPPCSRCSCIFLPHLTAKAGNMGFFCPDISKTTFFRTIILDGAYPRKTFSMGEADEKRFYVECRAIVP